MSKKFKSILVGLTYTALNGVCKQSVEDVERLFGDSVVNWMEINTLLLKLNICVSSATGSVPVTSKDYHLHSEASLTQPFEVCFR